MHLYDVEKTTLGLLRATFIYCLLGLKNTRATYERATTTIFHDMLHDFLEDYIEDIFV